ncbi:hypothetical protein M0R72_15500 [Candidatus Pacearchaeota archaeon]|jgi:hypothetical protein|nr:hypothetical protein [Candidatus Pacearchaeota archaeon]
MSYTEQLIIDYRHPSYYRDMAFWDLWRNTYNGGDDYTTRYLEKFTTRETTLDFNTRMGMTPCAAFAKAAVNDIRNAIFQRMRDVLRKDGSQSYQKASEGLDGGVDLRGSNMSAFMGYEALTELLVMGRVGIYIDMPIMQATTLADTRGARPYLYMYPVEDILSWTGSRPDQNSEFQAVLLRDKCVDFGDLTSYSSQLPVELPKGGFTRYRFVFLCPNDGKVKIQFFNEEGNPISPDNVPLPTVDPIRLELDKIPFTMMDIGDSTLKDVCKHQVALLNLGSSDVAYALKANIPFYTEQKDLRAVGDHLKHATSSDGSAEGGGQAASNQERHVGATQGIYYDLRAERPGFVHPSPEPLEVSLKLQEKLEDDIRKLVNLAVANKVGRAISAESKDMDNQGLEAGLSFIGMILENCERRIAEHWAAYEERNPVRRLIPVIKYPDRYSLKSDLTRLDEAKKLNDLMYSVPGQKVKREIAKCIVASLLAGKVSVETMDDITTEIENAPYTTSDPDVILKAKDAGVVGDKTACLALGFNEDEADKAQKDHIERLTEIAISQSTGGGSAAANPAARGLPDLSPTPAIDAKAEKDGQPTRGPVSEDDDE